MRDPANTVSIPQLRYIYRDCGIYSVSMFFCLYFLIFFILRQSNTGVSKRQFSVLNSGIQVSFFRTLPLQNLVFLKFYSLNEEAVRTKI